MEAEDGCDVAIVTSHGVTVLDNRLVYALLIAACRMGLCVQCIEGTHVTA